MEYIEEVDDDGLDALLVERNRSEDEEESNQANDEFEDDRNDNILIHRQDPDERLEHSELGGERYSSIDNKSEIDKEISPSNLLTINDDCDTNPNFAIIVDFLDKFAEHLGIKPVSINDLKTHLQNLSEKVNPDLIQIHTSLLKRVKLSKKMLITKRSWEKGLVLFCRKSKLLRCECEELESVGYSMLDVNIKLKILKVLMEHQFDISEFKIVTETLPVESIRHEPAGKDLDGLIYWTILDDFANLRIYMEDCNYFSWDCMAKNQPEFETLLDKLMRNKLYKMDLERRKNFEAKQNEEADLKEQIKNLEESERQEMIPEPSESKFKCEVCPENYEVGVDLMKHYALTHLACKMKEKFNHLVEKDTCKLCKEVIIDEVKMFVHIAADHDKINLVLKENGLKTVEDIQESNTVNAEKPEVKKDDVKEDKEESSKTLEALEQKLKDVQKQMSVESNMNVYALADMKDIADGLTESDNEVNQVEEEEPLTERLKKKGKKKKRKKGRPKKEPSPPRILRRSSRNNVPPNDLKIRIVDVTKEAKVKERVEKKQSCYKCGQWQIEDSNRVYACKQCGHGWHQKCVTPPLTRKPDSKWQCPLCDHCDLVTSLQQTLSEMMVLMERVEERRLAEMEVNQSLEAPEEDEEQVNQEVPECEPEPKEDPSVTSREIIKYMPDYYESSDDEDSKRKVVPVAPRLICSCSGDGSCLFCKKMRGCTCEGQGTCRLCELDEEKKQKEESDDDIEIIDDEEDDRNQAELSTTELFLLGMTDPKRTPSPRPRGHVRMRGSGRGRTPLQPQGPVRQAISQPQLNTRHVIHMNQPSLRARGQFARMPRPRAPVNTLPQVRVNYGTQQTRPQLQRPRLLRPRIPQTRPRNPAQLRGSSGQMMSGVPVRGQARMTRASPYQGQIIRRIQSGVRPRFHPVARAPRPPRPNVVKQIYHQQPVHQPLVYDSYQNYSQNLGASSNNEDFASASTYYEQAEVFAEDVVMIDDDDDEIEEIAEQNIFSKLPSGIDIQRI